MTRLAILPALLCLALPVQAQEKDAKALAQEILDKGAALFDMHDAKVMAATYTDDARIFWVDRESATSPIRVSVKEGRDQVEAFYRDLFKDSKEKTTSKNIVNYARFVAPDVLLIEGDFEPNTAHDGKYAFFQERVKQGDKWLINSLRIYILPKS
jgi:ketosteroid isomerase-like protein